jgi:hypothetical protein
MNEQTEAITLQTYTLELIGPPLSPTRTGYERDILTPGMPIGWPRTQPELPTEFLREVEENLSDLLPEGYEVCIREWDAKEEHPDV